MTTCACSYFILFLWKIVTTRKINKHVSPTTDTVVILLNIVISTKNGLINFIAKVNLKTPNRFNFKMMVKYSLASGIHLSDILGHNAHK